MPIEMLSNFILKSVNLNYGLIIAFINIFMNIFNNFDYDIDFYIYMSFIVLTKIRIIWNHLAIIKGKNLASF